MSAEKTSVGYGTIWVYLMVLVVVGVIASKVLPHGIGVIAIFAAALVKAYLVLRHYMHVHGVPGMIYALIGLPVVIFFIMIFALVPDIAQDPRKDPPPKPAVEAQH